MGYPLLIVSHGLISNQDGFTLHPDLFLWEKSLSKYKQQWFDCTSKNPLAVYAALLDIEPALLLASKLPTNTAKQYWVASPYHGQLARDAVRVMPESMMPWCEEDAVWACETLNPLLAEEGMRLYAIGSALLLACNKPLHATPVVFADIAGKLLPNRHPDGADGGRIMRLMAEIQMLFKQKPAAYRRERGDVDVHGLWFWGGCECSISQKKSDGFTVATRNAFLQSIVDGKDAHLVITEAENLSHFVKQHGYLSKQVILMGENHAVLLKQSLFPRFGVCKWIPKSVKAESELFAYLKKTSGLFTT